jgi:plastocyanin
MNSAPQPLRLLGLAALILSLVPAAQAAGSLSGRVVLSEQGENGVQPSDDHGNAVIFVAGFREAAPTGRNPKLEQKNKAFSERVLVVTQGETVSFPNQDGIHHNVWSKSEAKSFDLGLYKFPDARTVTFDKPGIVTVFCNIHPQMIATILVLPNPRYAITGPDGAFRIEGVKPGEYAVYAWVEGAKPEKRAVKIEEGKDANLDFKLTLRRIPIRHLNKEGKPYEKY